MSIPVLNSILDCIPYWMKRYFDPDANPLDMSQATTAAGRRSSMYGRRSSMFDALPPWQAAAEDPLDLSGHSTVPGRRSSVYEPIPDTPARRRSSVAPDAPEIARADPLIFQSHSAQNRQDFYTGGDELLRHSRRILPQHASEETLEYDPTQATQPIKDQYTPIAAPSQEAKRSWPEPPSKGERRVVSSNYSAVEIHGFFGLIDDGSAGEGRMLIVHVPKWIRGYFLDIKQGDTLHVYHARGKKVGGVLTVLSTGRHKYYAPGRRVTTCTVCVPEEQWAPFSQL